MKIIWRSLKNGKRTVTKIKNNYIQSFQVANFATWSWCGSLRPAPFLLCPFVGWTPRVQLIFIFKWSKRPLDSGGGRCDHYHFCGISALCFWKSKAQNEPLILVWVSATRTKTENVAWTKTIHTTPDRSTGQNDPLILHIPPSRSTVQFGPLIFKLSKR